MAENLLNMHRALYFIPSTEKEKKRDKKAGEKRKGEGVAGERRRRK